MISLWTGFALGAGLLAWVVIDTPGAANLVSWPACVLIVGGMAATVMVQEGAEALFRALGRAAQLMLPNRASAPEAAVAELSRLARRAHLEGGTLALRGETGSLADDGFLARAINAAIATNDGADLRRILEADIGQVRRERVQEAEVFQTMAGASPILGLMGTLLGMIRVVASIADPMNMGSAMALALSSDFVALALSQMVCAPIAGRLMAETRRELLLREIILEGVLLIQAGKPVYRVELHLAAYARRRERQYQEAAAPLGRAAQPA